MAYTCWLAAGGAAMVNIVLGIEGVDQDPVLQELSDQGGRNIAVPAEISEKVILRIVRELLLRSRPQSNIVFLAATKNGETRFFRFAEILYIESRGNLVCIVTAADAFEFYGSLCGIEKIAEGFGFVRIHGSFLISLIHIRAYNARFVRMDNGMVINIGRRFLAPFREAVNRLAMVRI